VVKLHYLGHGDDLVAKAFFQVKVISELFRQGIFLAVITHILEYITPIILGILIFTEIYSYRKQND
jgi:hypothetical protein